MTDPKLLALIRQLIGPPVRKCDWCNRALPTRAPDRFCCLEHREAEAIRLRALYRRWRAFNLRTFSGWQKAASIAFGAGGKNVPVEVEDEE